MTDQASEIVRRYLMGESILSISTGLGIGYGTIRGILVLNGVEIRNRRVNGHNPESHKASYTPTEEEIAKATEEIRGGWTERERVKRLVSPQIPVQPPRTSLIGSEHRGNYRETI